VAEFVPPPWAKEDDEAFVPPAYASEDAGQAGPDWGEDAPPTTTAPQAAALAAGRSASLGLAPRAMALESAIASASGPSRKPEYIAAPTVSTNDYGALNIDLRDTLKSMGERVQGLNRRAARFAMDAVRYPKSTFANAKAAYEKALPEAREGFDRAVEEHPYASFMGSVGAGALANPANLAQAVAGAGMQAAGSSSADYGKVLTGDAEEAGKFATDVGVGTALGAAGNKAPILTGLGMAGYGALSEDMPEGQRTQLILGGLLGAGSSAARRVTGAVKAHRDAALDEVGQGLVAKDEGEARFVDKKLVDPRIKARERALAAMMEEAQGEDAARGRFAREDAAGRKRAIAMAGRRERAQMKEDQGNIDRLDAAIKAARVSTPTDAPTGEGGVSAGQRAYDAALKKAQDFEASIPARVKSKEAAEFGALIHRIATLKTLGRAIPEELLEAQRRYETNSPEIVREFLAKNPGDLAREYEVSLRAELEGLRGSAEAKRPGAVPTAEPSAPARPIDDILQANPELYELAQRYPGYEETIPGVRVRPVGEGERVATSGEVTNPGSPRRAARTPAPATPKPWDDPNLPGEQATLLKQMAADPEKRRPYGPSSESPWTGAPRGERDARIAAANDAYGALAKASARPGARRAAVEGRAGQPVPGAAPVPKLEPLGEIPWTTGPRQSMDQRVAEVVSSPGRELKDLALKQIGRGSPVAAGLDVLRSPVLRANVLGAVQKAMVVSPEFAAKWGPVLSNAATRGEAGVLAALSVLGKDPDFAKDLQATEGAGE
jgi:hypothetical protein